MKPTLALCLTVMALGSACLSVWAEPVTEAAKREPVSLTLDGDKVQYSADKKSASISGNVRVLLRAPGYSGRAAVVQSDKVDVDLVKGIITAEQGGRIVVGPALLTGGRLYFNAPTQEFSIEQARGFMALPTPYAVPGDPLPMAYFQGQEVSKKDDTVTITRGRITTCPEDDPDYFIRARRIKYNVPEGELTVYKASVSLYGVRLPTLPWAKFGVGPRGGGKGGFSLATMPGYSSREGVYLPYAVRLSGPDDPWRVIGNLRLTSKRGLTGSVTGNRSAGSWDYEAQVSRKEWAVDDLEDALSLSRYPELTFTRHFGTGAGADHKTSLDLNFGDFQEELEDQPSTGPLRDQVEEMRALARLNYTANVRQHDLQLGNWYGGSARISTYSSGESYQDLELFAGAGARVTDELHLYATLRHHFTGGTTPFLFDDVDIKTELDPGMAWNITDRWKVDAWARYDLDESEMRDYRLGLGYRAGCLTWGVYYRDIGNRVGVQLDLTGLTGGTRPQKKRSSFVKQMELEGLCVSHIEEGSGKINIRGDECEPDATGTGQTAPKTPSREPESDKEM